MRCFYLQDSELWNLVLLGTCVLNSDQAPWDDAKWYSAGRTAAEDYMQVMTPTTCPVFCELLPRILRDNGSENCECDDEAVLQAWHMVREAWNHKNPKAAASRLV